MTPLLDSLIELLGGWRVIFPQERTFVRALRLALAQVLAPGVRTISRVIAASGLDQQDWSADYRVFSRSPWQQRRLFEVPIREGVLIFLIVTILPSLRISLICRKPGGIFPMCNACVTRCHRPFM